MKKELSRREFVGLVGKTAVVVSAIQEFGWVDAAFGVYRNPKKAPLFRSLPPSSKDAVILADGFEYQMLAMYGDVINLKAQTFGSDTDYTEFMPASKTKITEGYLWVNHERPERRVFFGGSKKKTTKAILAKERKEVGGSLLYIKQNPKTRRWSLDLTHPHATRLDGSTPIPFAGGRKIAGKSKAIGTLANCSGGITPWGTFLTCEENYQKFYGENLRTNMDQLNDPPIRKFKKSNGDNWETVEALPPEHYGWVVEFNPKTGKAVKHMTLGRFSHEGATVTTTKDGRAVAYSGDDAKGECLYKFVAKRPNTLEEGTLYVADTIKGKWIPLTKEAHPKKLKHYTQDQIYIHTREASKIVGGTPLDRPEGIAIDRTTKTVYVALTNNDKRKNYNGSILKVEETGGRPEATTFKASTFKNGGAESGFSCPDNIVFDPNGNLWITTDISGYAIGTPRYQRYKNNGLFVVPMKGPHAGIPMQVASAPIDAEFTGPSFTPDGGTLFLSVQHPGQLSSAKQYTSHWPRGGDTKPRSSVIAISGKSLQKLMAI